MGLPVIFEIPGRFPGMNEIIGIARTHPMASAHQKKKFQKIAMKAAIDAGLADIRFKGPVHTTFVWTEPTARRDPDNISAAVKFIFDGLVQLKILTDDNMKHVLDIHHEFAVDKTNPRIEVQLREVA